MVPALCVLGLAVCRIKTIPFFLSLMIPFCLGLMTLFALQIQIHRRQMTE